MSSFFLSSDQRIFKESLARLLADNWSLDKRRKVGGSEPGYDRELWGKLADLGALGAFLPESAGGTGGGGLDLMIVAEALGKANVVSPFLGSVPFAATLLTKRTELLAGVASGKSVIADAIGEPGSRYDLFHVETRAAKSGSSYRLDGYKAAVPYAGAADWLIVSARTAGQTRDRSGISLFLLDAKRKGVTIKSGPTMDGRRGGEVTLEGVPVSQADVIGDLAALERAVDLTILAQGAEAVGHMRALLDQTVAYTKTREQFGAKLSSFQALQHRMVDMFAATETAASAVQAALARVDSPVSAVDPGQAVLAKLTVDKSARLVGQEAIQLHGGMGMTDDLAAGHHFKRLTMMSLTLADHGKLMERFRDLEQERAT